MSDTAYERFFMLCPVGALLIRWEEVGDPLSFRFLEVNPAGAKASAIPEEQYVGQLLRDVPGLPETGLGDVYARAIETGEPIDLPNYVYRDVTYRVRVIPDGDRLLYAVYDDITARTIAEEGRREHLEEVERFNDMAVGRELRMIELKEEVNTLRAELGLGPRYKVADEPG